MTIIIIIIISQPPVRQRKNKFSLFLHLLHLFHLSHWFDMFDFSRFFARTNCSCDSRIWTELDSTQSIIIIDDGWIQPKTVTKKEYSVLKIVKAESMMMMRKKSKSQKPFLSFSLFSVENDGHRREKKLIHSISSNIDNRVLESCLCVRMMAYEEKKIKTLCFASIHHPWSIDWFENDAIINANEASRISWC